MSNAIKYSPQGGKISLELSENNEMLIINISDEGMGIEKEEIDKIFDPFYRAISSDSVKGSGLGLAIVKNYIELHHGKIKVKSTPNVGSTFTVILPNYYKN